MTLGPEQTIELEFSEGALPSEVRKLIYARSAYRHEPDFLTSAITRSGNLLDAPRSRRMIEPESKVSDNYQRLICKNLSGGEKAVFDFAS